MSVENPIYIEDYRNHHYAVHCFRHGNSAEPWTVSVEVFQDEALALPRKSLKDKSFSTYMGARNEGKRLAEDLIDQIEDGSG